MACRASADGCTRTATPLMRTAALPPVGYYVNTVVKVTARRVGPVLCHKHAAIMTGARQ